MLSSSLADPSRALRSERTRNRQIDGIAFGAVLAPELGRPAQRDIDGPFLGPGLVGDDGADGIGPALEAVETIGKAAFVVLELIKDRPENACGEALIEVLDHQGV